MCDQLGKISLSISSQEKFHLFEERLQMIQHYRLTHFEQLLQPTSIELETNEEFLSLFGQPLSSTMKKSQISRTSLYVNRTQNELANINEIQMTFRKRLANIFHIHFNPKLISSVQQRMDLVCNLIKFERRILFSISP